MNEKVAVIRLFVLVSVLLACCSFRRVICYSPCFWSAHGFCLCFYRPLFVANKYGGVDVVVVVVDVVAIFAAGAGAPAAAAAVSRWLPLPLPRLFVLHANRIETGQGFSSTVSSEALMH